LLPQHALVGAGGRAVFTADREGRGLEAWSTDGRPQGTSLLADACPGRCDGFVEGPFPIAGDLFFIATEPANKKNIWRTDGTAAGTRRFTHFSGDVLPHGPWLALRGQHLYFTARTESGDELLLGDGTPAGTRVLTDFADFADSSVPLELLPVGNELYFTAEEGTSRNLWRTQGSPESTDLAWSGSAAIELTPAPGKVLFVERGIFGERDLWSWDHAQGSATRLTGLPAEVPHNPELVAFQDDVFFTAHEAGVATIWRTDGTLDGTRKVVELPPDVLSEFVRHLTATGPEVYFTALEFTGGGGVWRTDGTPAGTRKAGDLTSQDVAPPEFTRVGPWVYFVASKTDASQLWQTDGAATTPVHVAGDPRTPSGVRELTPFKGALYFFARSPSGRGLWRSDGTPGGTVLVRDFRETRQFFETEPNFLTVLEDLLFFVADDGVGGRELWRSDGTSAGTSLVRDVLPGPSSSRPGDLGVAGGRLFFAASDGVHGRELWQSDGTEHGTRLVQDIAPGAASANPQELTDAGDRLYFSAEDGLTGRELWLLDLATPGGQCDATATVLCLGERFRVQVTWRDFMGRTGIGRSVPLTADTGAFWFFAPENVEVILKVLDGRPLNDHHWVFYGALSSVEYALTVTDVQTGLTARYWNPSGQLASVADTTGFGPLGAFSVAKRSAPSPGTAPRVRARLDPAAATGACIPSPTRLCLRDGRFAVEATWKDFQANTGVGTAVPLTADTGWFWFFGPTNVEVVLKVLDGTALNGKHWVFYGALSSVEYTLRVTDTATGAVKTYTNPSGNLASVADTAAF
jgi:ELWxxDGT repeat protein